MIINQLRYFVVFLNTLQSDNDTQNMQKFKQQFAVI